MNKTVGERISEIRKAYGITQTELGKRIDKTQMTIAKYENGKVDVKVNTLLLLAKALECEITDFFEK